MPSSNAIFGLTNNSVLPGWLLLMFAHEWEWTPIIVRATVLFQCVWYAFCLLSGEKIKGASFTSFRGVATIFRKGGERTVLACWIHYLAFDLLIGEWIVNDAVAAGINHWILLPFIAATLMFGPFGFVLYNLLKLFLVGSIF